MKYLITVAFLLGTFSSFSQDPGGNDLKLLLGQIPHSREDTNKVKLYLKISRLYVGLNTREGFPYANSGLSLAKKLQWKKGIGSLNNCLGLLTGDTGNNTAARDYFEKSLVINRELNEKASIIANLNNIGRSYQRESNFSKASEYYFKALAFAEESGNDEQAALVGTNIAAMYITQNDLKNGEKYALLTIKKGKSSKAYIHESKGYELLALVKEYQSDTAKAKENYEKALSLVQKLGNKMAEVSILINVANLEKDQIKQVSKQLEIKRILDSIAPSSQTSILNLANLGVSYYNLGNAKSGNQRIKYFDTAESFLKPALELCKTTKIAEYKADVLMVISNIKEARGNYKAALEDFKEYSKINDSIFSQANKNKIASLQSKQEIDLKNKEIENKELQISLQQKQKIFFISGLILLGVIIGLLFWQNSTRKKTNTTLLHLNNELDEANKIKSKFFGILSHDLRSPIASLISFLRLQKSAPGLLSQEQILQHEQKITSSAESLLETMETMLLWSKGQMTNFKPEIKNIPVQSLFKDLESFFSNTANVQISYSNPDQLTLLTDENYLRTIMQNLTSNAIQALKNDKNGTIEWKAFQEKGKTILSITDNGPGVKNEQLKALYNETSVSGSKHGMGLHIIRDLAKSIGCHINLQTQNKTGAEFVLSF